MIGTDPAFVFVHIPRTGGSSIEYTLREFSHVPVEVLQTTAQNGTQTLLTELGFQSATGRRWKHLSADDLASAVDGEFWKQAFKFSIVRNPWDRMVSLYEFLGRKELDGTHTSTAGISFKEWLTRRYPQSPPTHLTKRTQWQFLQDSGGSCAMDFVARFETLREDWGEITRRLSITKPLAHINFSQRRHYGEYYCSETKAIVEEYFEADILKFGYRFEEGSPTAEIR